MRALKPISCFCKQLTTVFPILFVCLLASGYSVAASAGTEWQRDNYKDAVTALKRGKLEKFQQISSGLTDYSLYPYLRYKFISKRLSRVQPIEVEHFFKNYSDLPDANKLRKRWLKFLASQKRWQEFLNYYTLQSDPQLQCLQLQARINTNNTSYLLEDIRSQWLTGHSLPDECNPAFKMLYQSHLMDDDLLWQRIRLSMEEGKTSLAAYLARQLSPELKIWQQRWSAMHQNPARGTLKPVFEDNVYAREILIHGLNRLARSNINQAIKHWNNLQDQYDFEPQQIAHLQRTLAIRAVKKQHPSSLDLLDQVEASLVDDEVFYWRLRAALKDKNWPQLMKWLDGFPEDEDLRIPWWYWRGRALEATGDEKAARYVFQKIARERDYYGFLAADRLGIEYQMNHYPLPDNPTAREEFLKTPAIQRAQELRIIGFPYQARREWQHALNRMTKYQMQIAAIVAREFGWHDRVIFTLGKAKMYDDLVLRFPLQYKQELEKHASKRQLDLGWVYGLVRSESAFVENARSPAGALGLMQVMPATGKDTARRMGWKKFNSKMLLQADKNIPIGSTYLKQLLDRFNGNMILATAAYNAGPHRVNQWLPKNGCIDPDMWVEQIPFNETRKYVKRVLSYASIYDWRLEQGIVPLKDRMAAVFPKKKDTMVSALACSAQALSMQLRP